MSDLIGNTPVTISPVKITPPDPSKYVTPEKFRQVTDEYDSQILYYQKQAAERDQVIEDMKNERATLLSKVDFANEVVQEKSRSEQQIIELQQRMMGKGTTISHLRAKHPHQALDVTKLEDKKHELTKRLNTIRQHHIKLEQQNTHLTRSIEQRPEEITKWKTQKESLKTLYQKTLKEHDDLKKDKQHILNEYKELQQLWRKPLTNTTGQKARVNKENKKQKETKKEFQRVEQAKEIWEDTRKFAERLRKAHDDLDALDKTQHIFHLTI